MTDTCSEVAHATEDIPMTRSKLDPKVYRQFLKRVVSDPALSSCMEADDRLRMIQVFLNSPEILECSMEDQSTETLAILLMLTP